METVVNVVAVWLGAILLVKKKDVWILPGGKRNPGESNFDCLSRELKEELPGACLLEAMELPEEFEGITPHHHNWVIVRLFTGRIDGDITPAAEITGSIRTTNPECLNLSEITRRIIAFLRVKGHL